MAQGPGHHRSRQIRRVAGAGHQGHLEAEQAPVVVVADLVVEPEAVTPPGDQEVVVAVDPKLDRHAQPRRGDGRDAGEEGGLRFLAAEAAAHPPAFDLDLVRVAAQCVGDQVLHLGRMLGGAMHPHRVALHRDRVADLAFEVELFLAAEIEAAVEPVRRAGNRGPRPAGPALADEVHRRHDIVLRRVRGLGGQHGLERRRGQHFMRQRGRPAGGVARPGDHRAERLTGIAQCRSRVERREDRLVVDDRSPGVGAGNVRRGQHGDDARHRAEPGGVERNDPAAGDRRQTERSMQGPREFRQVIDVRRFAGHVQVRALVRPADADPRAAGLGAGLGRRIDAGREHCRIDRPVHFIGLRAGPAGRPVRRGRRIRALG